MKFMSFHAPLDCHHVPTYRQSDKRDHDGTARADRSGQGKILAESGLGCVTTVMGSEGEQGLCQTPRSSP